MSRNRQASKAKPVERCYLTCTECGRPCYGTLFGRQSHRFDCCGVIAAHVPNTRTGGWFRSGPPAYLTGPSQTTPRNRQASKAIPLNIPALADVVRATADFEAQAAKVAAVMNITVSEAMAKLRDSQASKAKP